MKTIPNARKDFLFLDTAGQAYFYNYSTIKIEKIESNCVDIHNYNT